jgi:hypothetical protein
VPVGKAVNVEVVDSFAFIGLSQYLVRLHKSLATLATRYKKALASANRSSAFAMPGFF